MDGLVVDPHLQGESDPIELHAIAIGGPVNASTPVAALGDGRVNPLADVVLTTATFTAAP